jgi:RimJ/RimL family protein N-acetyltransferase
VSGTTSPDPTALIVGERVKICAVRDSDFATWASWFNSARVTTFLDHGEFPNSEMDQRQFFATARASGRFIGMVRSIASDALLGVISLSEVNRARQSAQLSLVVPQKCDTAPLAAMEAQALVTEHALTRMGLARLWSGHAHPGLERWANRTELIGWVADGIARQAFVHGDTTSDVVQTSALKLDVDRLRSRRAGSLWCGTERMQRMLRDDEFAGVPPAVELVAEAVRVVAEERWRLLERVEGRC